MDKEDLPQQEQQGLLQLPSPERPLSGSSNSAHSDSFAPLMPITQKKNGITRADLVEANRTITRSLLTTTKASELCSDSTESSTTEVCPKGSFCHRCWPSSICSKCNPALIRFQRCSLVILAGVCFILLILICIFVLLGLGLAGRSSLPEDSTALPPTSAKGYSLDGENWATQWPRSTLSQLKIRLAEAELKDLESCGSNMVLCSSGDCKPGGRCDFFTDCSDLSDEQIGCDFLSIASSNQKRGSGPAMLKFGPQSATLPTRYLESYQRR